MRRRRVVALAAVILLGAVAAVASWLAFRGGGEPVSVAQAVDAFRSEASGTEDGAGPAHGVYAYATEGSEEIDAFLGSRHDYPESTTITVAAGGCGVELRWRALEERSTTWELCPADDGLLLAGYVESHSFFGQTEITDYRCGSPIPWLPSDPVMGEAVTRECRSSDSELALTGRVIGAEELQVAGTAVATIRARYDLVLTGRTRGTGFIELWLRDDGLPVRLVLANENASRSAIGDVHYAERAELELLELEPKR